MLRTVGSIVLPQFLHPKINEFLYCACDVFVLCDFAKIMFDEFLKKRGYIPDTATQILSKEMQDNAIKYGKAFLGRRYDRIMQQYDDEKQQRHAILKSIHGKIFGFQVDND